MVAGRLSRPSFEDQLDSVRGPERLILPMNNGQGFWRIDLGLDLYRWKFEGSYMQ